MAYFFSAKYGPNFFFTKAEITYNTPKYCYTWPEKSVAGIPKTRDVGLSKPSMEAVIIVKM